MAIINLQAIFTGEVGVRPGLARLKCTDTLAAVSTAGYINNEYANSIGLQSGDFVFVNYGDTASLPSTEILVASFSNSQWTLNLQSSGVVLPTTANHIATYQNTDGLLGQDSKPAINGGDIQAGLSGTAGSMVSFPSTAARGSFRFEAAANTGNTVTKITNAAMGQTTTLTIPDPGGSAANVILSANSGTQTISTGSLALTLGNITTTAGSITATANNIIAGSSGNAGLLRSFSSTASRGSLDFKSTANAGNTVTTLTNVAMGQASVISIADPGTATANIPVSAGTGSLLLGNTINAASYPIFTVDITVGFAALAAAGSVTLLASSSTHRYRILNIMLNSGGTNFSGGGGDRNLSITDNTTTYSIVPAASMQSLVNSIWGGTPTPLPSGVAINTLTAAGAPLVAKYSGGAADYSAGSAVITIIAIQVA